MVYPTDIEIEKLHQQYAINDLAFQIIHTHCQIVEQIAMQLLDKKPRNIDEKLVHVGALLHDIGAYKVIDKYGEFHQGVRHGIFGEEILRAEGLPKEICRIASRHTGVGLTKQDVIDQKLPITPADYTAETIEERIIMYADKFHTKAVKSYFCSFNFYQEFVQKFGGDKVAKLQQLADEFGEPDLETLAKKYKQEIKK